MPSTQCTMKYTGDLFALFTLVNQVKYKINAKHFPSLNRNTLGIQRSNGLADAQVSWPAATIFGFFEASPRLYTGSY